MDVNLNFPELREPYATALREAVAHAFTRTRPIGIVASGTIIRGNPDASSDIDLYVIHGAPWRQRVQRWFNGVPCEMFINPPRAVEQYFDEERADGRPHTAHMLATGFVVLNTSPVVDQLLERARAIVNEPPNYSAFHTTMTRYGAATLFEDALDIAERDAATAAMLLDKAVLAALDLFFIARNLPVPRNKELLAVMHTLDAAAGDAALAYYTLATWPNKFSAASILFNSVIGARGFFEWESEPQVVA